MGREREGKGMGRRRERGRKGREGEGREGRVPSKV